MNKVNIIILPLVYIILNHSLSHGEYVDWHNLLNNHTVYKSNQWNYIYKEEQLLRNIITNFMLD